LQGEKRIKYHIEALLNRPSIDCATGLVAFDDGIKDFVNRDHFHALVVATRGETIIEGVDTGATGNIGV
jgi:hypothetical protein